MYIGFYFNNSKWIAHTILLLLHYSPQHCLLVLQGQSALLFITVLQRCLVLSYGLWMNLLIFTVLLETNDKTQVMSIFKQQVDIINRHEMQLYRDVDIQTKYKTWLCSDAAALAVSSRISASSCISSRGLPSRTFCRGWRAREPTGAPITPAPRHLFISATFHSRGVEPQKLMSMTSSSVDWCSPPAFTSSFTSISDQGAWVKIQYRMHINNTNIF